MDSVASHCIFKIPRNFSRIYHTVFGPRIVSIGPYHHGKEHVMMIEKHKSRFLQFFVAKAEKNGVGLEELEDTVRILEDDIRAAYSENLDGFDQKKLVDMMVLDGCFLLVLFCAVAQRVAFAEFNDPVLRMPWVLDTIASDILLLENQMPFTVLEALFNRLKLFVSGGLKGIVCEFFSGGVEQSEESLEKYKDLEAKHLLDMFRKMYIPRPAKETSERRERQNFLPLIGCSKLMKRKPDSDTAYPFLKFIMSAKKLHLRGIEFEKSEDSDSILDIKFKKGVVQIPPIAMDESIILFLHNCVAFEQFCADCSNHYTSYVVFMSCLMNDAADAMFLTEKRILENSFKATKELCQSLRNMLQGVGFEMQTSYLRDVFRRVDEHSSRGLHLHWASFKHAHFDNPWSCMSSCAALTLLLVTILQAFFTVYSYFRPSK